MQIPKNGGCPHLKNQGRTFILHIICIFLNISIRLCENMDVIMNVQSGYVGSYVQAHLKESNYELFQWTFFDNKTKSVRLKYQFLNNGNTPTITKIKPDDVDDFDDVLYFRCNVIQDNLSTKCIRNVLCNSSTFNLCSHGLGISWQNGEYLSAKSLKNKTVYCAGDDNVTCYRLKNNYTPKTTFISPTTTPSNFVHSDLSTLVELTSEPMDTDISTATPTNASFTSATYLKDYSTEGSHLDSAAVIARATVAVVIACIIGVVVIVVCVKIRIKKESASNGKTANSHLEMTGRLFDDSVYSQQKSNSYRDIYGKATTRDAIDEDGYTQYNTNTKNYINAKRQDDIVNQVSYTISGSDTEDIQIQRRTKGPLKVVNIDKDIDVDYTTIDHNSRGVISTMVNQVGNHGNSSISMFKEENPVTFTEDYATVNKNAGYKNFKETKQNQNRAEEHEYNNIRQDNTTIESNEPIKNIYSKLRENIRKLEHHNVGDGAALQAGRGNFSTIATDL